MHWIFLLYLFDFYFHLHLLPLTWVLMLSYFSRMSSLQVRLSHGWSKMVVSEPLRREAKLRSP